MKKTIINLLFLVVSGMATAQTLSVDDVEVLPGGTASYELKINVGEGAYTGFQYQMQFPASGFATTGTTTVLPTWQGASFSVGDIVSGKANASAYSSADKEIPSGDIMVGSVEFSVSNDVPVGEYDVTISGFDFLDGTNYVHVNGGSDLTFKVKVVNALTVVLDEYSTTAPTAATNVNVRVKRTFNAGYWNTICLPFAMTNEQMKAAFGNDVELAEFKGWETTEYDDNDNPKVISVSFTSVSAIEANIPYIIKVTAPISEFSAYGVDINPDEEPVVTVGKKSKGTLGSFTGTFVPVLVEEECLFLKNNAFKYSTGKTQLKAYRGYFYFQDILSDYIEGANAPMFFSIDNGTTKVDSRIMQQIESGKVYNMEGQYVGESSDIRQLSKGIYIVNGKKKVIK